MTVAIYYHPEAYTITGPKLMGRHAAGESFLRGFIKYSTAKEFWIQVDQLPHANHFKESVRALGRDVPIKSIKKNTVAALLEVGGAFFPAPGIGVEAWRRAPYGHAAWSLCGICHTTSSGRAMDAIVDLITSPVQPWDAVICPSTAVKDNVLCLLQGQEQYLRDRMGISKVVLPQLPVIPLGIHTRDFSYSPAQREAARKRVGAGEGTLVVLYVGRLSFHAKAHPLAMYQAIEKAAKTLPPGKDVVLVECGWHMNEALAAAFREGARLACPNIRTVLLDGRAPENRETAWASGDVFCSLSDNIQETFGIVPIEAMAAAMPVVVSDWDGYRDSVRDGVDGFRIPTTMPPAGLASDLALRHALDIDTYDMYCGHACSLVAVDVEAAARAFAQLFASRELRKTMGDAGRERARTIFDWESIIPRYEALWAELAQTRKSHAPHIKPLPHPWPARMDPLHAFANYPTRTLDLEKVLRLTDANLDSATRRLREYQALSMVNFARAVLPSEAELQAVLAKLVAGPASAANLVQDLPAPRRRTVFRALCWLMKLGILEISNAGERAASAP